MALQGGSPLNPPDPVARLEMTRTHVPPTPVDLRSQVEALVKKAGLAVAFEPEVLKAADAAKATVQERRDLTSWPWCSIDSDQTKDFDQVSHVVPEGDGWRLYIAIADVAAFVPQGSVIDRRAFQNTATVYTGVANFPMLPRRLSEDRASLVPDKNARRGLLTCRLM